MGGYKGEIAGRNLTEQNFPLIYELWRFHAEILVKCFHDNGFRRTGNSDIH